MRSCAGVPFGVIVGVFALVPLFGCQRDKVEVEQPITAYRDRMLVQHQQEGEARRAASEQTDRRPLDQRRPLIQLAGSEQEGTERTALMTGPEVDEAPSPAEVLAQIPEPRDAERVFVERLKQIEETAREERVVNQYKRVVEKAREYLVEFRRPRQVDLSLAECVHRALANNYVIRLEAYTPAISRAQLVEAEAAFDAAFFLDFSYNNVDQATASELLGNQTDVRSYRGGIRQLLP
ncbi:MAG: hypothetical protein ACE5I3_13485, partial [Phycisphaerae bacterium]